MDYKKLNGKMKFVMLLRGAYVAKNGGFQRGQFPFVDYVIHNENCTQQDVASALHVTPACVAVSLGRMESAGILRRTKDPANARRNLISVTAKGKTLYEQGKKAVEALDVKMFDGFDESELEAFDKSLDKIIYNVTGEKTDVSPETLLSFKQKMENCK